MPDGIRDSDGSTTYIDKMYNTLTLNSKASLPYSTRYFSYNNSSSNTCVSTAAAIFTYYYYDHVSKLYLKYYKYKKSQKELVRTYKRLLKDKGQGTEYADVKNGINILMV